MPAAFSPFSAIRHGCARPALAEAFFDPEEFASAFSTIFAFSLASKNELRYLFALIPIRVKYGTALFEVIRCRSMRAASVTLAGAMSTRPPKIAAAKRRQCAGDADVSECSYRQAKRRFSADSCCFCFAIFFRVMIFSSTMRVPYAREQYFSSRRKDFMRRLENAMRMR